MAYKNAPEVTPEALTLKEIPGEYTPSAPQFTVCSCTILLSKITFLPPLVLCNS